MEQKSSEAGAGAVGDDGAGAGVDGSDVDVEVEVEVEVEVGGAACPELDTVVVCTTVVVVEPHAASPRPELPITIATMSLAKVDIP